MEKQTIRLISYLQQCITWLITMVTSFCHAVMLWQIELIRFALTKLKFSQYFRANFLLNDSTKILHPKVTYELLPLFFIVNISSLPWSYKMTFRQVNLKYSNDYLGLLPAFESTSIIVMTNHMYNVFLQW